MVTHIARVVWINRVRLPILHVVSWAGKMNISLSAFVPENLVLARRVRQSRPASACSFPYSGWIRCLLTGFLPSSAAASIYLLKPPYTIGSVPSLSGHAVAYRRGWQRESTGTGSVFLKVVPAMSAALAGHHGPINYAPLFPTPTIGMKWLY